MAWKTRRFLVRPLARALVVVLLAGSTVALGGARPSAPADDGRPARLGPGRFTTRIDNPLWPMAPGSRWVYRETDADGDAHRVEVTVTGRTITVLGIEARVVRDVVFENGRLQEATDDWYAQDAHGNIWQLGEVTHEYAGPETSTVGSWRAGVDGARPVLVLPAHPDPGTVYRQADAVVQVLSAGMTAKVPYGSFERVLVTEEAGPLEPGRVEHEFYARGVGPVLAVTVSGGSGREELVGFDHARTADTATGR
jgi:hypothetical protein